MVVGHDRARSRLLLRLLTELGEYPSDGSVGLPWRARWSVAPRPSVREVQALVRQQAERVDGVTVVGVDVEVGEHFTIRLSYTYSDPTSPGDAPPDSQPYDVQVMPVYVLILGGD